jgi:hypothetical protein
MSSPRLFLFFLSSCPFLLFDRAAGFLPPRPPVLSQAGARRCCQGWPLFSGHTLQGASALTAIEHDGKLDRSGRLHSCLLFILIRLRVSARYSDNGMLLLAGLATKSMARAIIASTYIRQLRSGLPRCCLHGRSRRRDGAHLSDGRSARVPICDADIQPHIRPARHTRLGCRNSVHCRGYRVRVAPCGTRDNARGQWRACAQRQRS